MGMAGALLISGLRLLVLPLYNFCCFFSLHSEIVFSVVLSLKSDMLLSQLMYFEFVLGFPSLKQKDLFLCG